jgi:hypothetical protein
MLLENAYKSWHKNGENPLKSNQWLLYRAIASLIEITNYIYSNNSEFFCICIPEYSQRISKIIISVQFILRKTKGKCVLVLDITVPQNCFSRVIESAQNNRRNHTFLSVITDWKCPDVRQLVDFTINITDLYYSWFPLVTLVNVKVNTTLSKSCQWWQFSVMLAEVLLPAVLMLFNCTSTISYVTIVPASCEK